MKAQLINLIFVSCSIVYSSSIYGQGPENEKGLNGISLIFEQDVLLEFTGLNSDRNYTQGLGIMASSGNLRKRLDKTFHLRNHPTYSYQLPAKIGIQIAGFTPDELRDSLPIIGDRPYSSVIFLSLHDSRVDQENFRMRSWSFYIGALGIPDVAKNAQTAIHKGQNNNNTQPPYNPMGWHNQISHGGEPTAMVVYQTKQLINTKPIAIESASNTTPNAKKIRHQLVSSMTINGGYITQFTYGLDYRFGRINLRNWYQDSQWAMDPVAVAVAQVDDNKVNYFKNRYSGFELFGFVGIKSGLMLYNASLHGQFKNSAYRLPYEDTGFFTNVGRAGITGNFKHIGVSVYGAWKSSEIMTPFARIHSWGGISLNFYW